MSEESECRYQRMPDEKCDEKCDEKFDGECNLKREGGTHEKESDICVKWFEKTSEGFRSLIAWLEERAGE